MQKKKTLLFVQCRQAVESCPCLAFTIIPGETHQPSARDCTSLFADCTTRPLRDRSAAVVNLF